MTAGRYACACACACACQLQCKLQYVCRPKSSGMGCPSVASAICKGQAETPPLWRVCSCTQAYSTCHAKCHLQCLRLFSALTLTSTIHPQPKSRQSKPSRPQISTLFATIKPALVFNITSTSHCHTAPADCSSPILAPFLLQHSTTQGRFGQRGSLHGRLVGCRTAIPERWVITQVQHRQPFCITCNSPS